MAVTLPDEPHQAAELAGRGKDVATALDVNIANVPACFTPTYVIRRSIGEW